MRCLIRTVPWDSERFRWAKDLARALPGGEIVEDTNHDGYDTLLRAFEVQGEDDAWHFEDDAILTNNWAAKARLQELFAPGGVIQAFGRFDKKSGWRAGGSFSYTLCFRIPGPMAPYLLEFASEPNNRKAAEEVANQPFDIIIGMWMKQHRLRYWHAVPSLVQHRIGPSMVGPRPRDRSSVNFVED